jgi:hypothetical protein
MTGREIIELKPEERDNGEIVYETAGGRPIPRETAFDAIFRKVLGITFTLGILALAMVFFFYIVLPIIVLVVAYVLLRKIYLSLVR